MKLFISGLALGAMLLASHAVHAQEYKIPVENTKDGQLILQDFTGELPVEGYNGTEIIISTDNLGETPDRAKGLKAVYPAGTDNTGIGLSLTKDGGRITVSCLVPFNRDVRYKIKVPSSLRLKITRGCERSAEVSISNMSAEVDVDNCQGIELKNVTGPLVLSSISGDIKVVFAEISKDKPISIADISGEIDVTLPAKTPANLNMSTISGAMYTDFDLTSGGKDMKKVGGSNIDTPLNGGGVDIKITNISGNIYLRKG
jgi:lia operon protein LiaG